ncbi:MAG: ATP-binding protein [Deltaproteobacteria bacterium]|nr:ATP-binding protein [Deltaproteobacteria bacterium]
MHYQIPSEFSCRFNYLHDAWWCAPRAERFVRHIGLSHHESAETAIIVSELVTNAVKYAGGGELKIRSLIFSLLVGVEIIVSDQGPGITDIHAVFIDGYSQGYQREPGIILSGSLGTGLGAVKRLSDKVEFTQAHDRGLIIRVIKYSRAGSK